MPDILDDLEGFLGPEAAAKLRANEGFRDRLTKGDELRGFYADTGGLPEPVTPPPAHREPPPAAQQTAPPASTETLAQIMAKLDSLGNIDERIKKTVDDQVSTRGNELVGNAIASSLAITRELGRIDARHRNEFGEDLDDNKLNAHIEAAKAAGRPFRTVTDAYEDLTREQRENRRVDDRVREQLKARASQNVPGAAGPSASPMMKVLKTGSGTPGSATHLDRAAAALSERMAERGETVS